MDNNMILQTQPSSGVVYKPRTYIINDKKELYRCYMPFIKGGGLFMPFTEDITPNKVAPGQNVLFVFSMLESKDRKPVKGTIVWINRNGLNKGVGVAFGEEPAMKSLKDQIESVISDLLLTKDATYTL
jgi:type IV pilus assembly protein PilZ